MSGWWRQARNSVRRLFTRDATPKRKHRRRRDRGGGRRGVDWEEIARYGDPSE